jgi:hypothetical protein
MHVECPPNQPDLRACVLSAKLLHGVHDVVEIAIHYCGFKIISISAAG